jgi:hypothetical protein
MSMNDKSFRTEILLDFLVVIDLVIMVVIAIVIVVIVVVFVVVSIEKLSPEFLP